MSKFWGSTKILIVHSSTFSTGVKKIVTITNNILYKIINKLQYKTNYNFVGFTKILLPLLCRGMIPLFEVVNIIFDKTPKEENI